MATRQLKIAAGTSKTRLKRAWQQLELDYAANITLTAAQVDYKELHCIVGTLTGNLELDIAGVSSNFIGDQLYLYLTADASDRTLTLGDNISATSTTFTVPATKSLCFVFSFNETAFVFNILKTTAAITDTVAESTPAAGVTVDGVLLKDGWIGRAVETVAAAGADQAGAGAITLDFAKVTGADGAKGARLPVASTGRSIVVSNTDDTNALLIYPGTGGKINRGSANAAVTIPANSTAVFYGDQEATTDWSVDITSIVGVFDTINELTAANGVAVDGVKLKDGTTRLVTALGTTPVGTVSIVEYGDGRDMVTELTLTNFIVGALAGAAAALGVGNIVYAFPAGQHFELVSALNAIVLTAAGTAVNTDTGLGSVIASGAIATLDGTATFEDRLTGQTIATAAGGGAAVSTVKAATAGIGTGISLNLAASVKNVFLNSAGTWNANNTGNLTASGKIILKWTKL